MMMDLIAAAALAAAWAPLAQEAPKPPAAPAASETADSLSIAMGETVVVRLGEGGRGLLVVSRTRDDPEGEVPADSVRFSFGSVAGQSMLSVENGYGRAFEYRARMFLGRRSATTSTCTVLPGISAFESWPHAIDRLEVSRAELLPPGPVASIRCR
ncbi:MAG TPA: hypothetical protein VF702_11055 [Allosphingosinicella sp.]|jgi:hypothetical protein